MTRRIAQRPKNSRRLTPCACASDRGILPITTEKYLMMVDLVGRIQRRGKRGKIPPILERLGIGTPDAWLDEYGQFAKQRDHDNFRSIAVRWPRFPVPQCGPLAPETNLLREVSCRSRVTRFHQTDFNFLLLVSLGHGTVLSSWFAA